MKLFLLCLLLCLASAQKHEATDGASTEEADQWTSDEDLSSPSAASHAPPHALSSEAEDDDDDLDLDSEEDHGRKAEDTYPDEDEDEDEEMYEDENPYDYEDEYKEEEEEKEGEERIKRKVIFGGGGGYGGVHRSRGGGGGGDPYGRRRDNHNYHGPGPDYGNYGSWPYGRGEYVDTSSFDRAATPDTTTTTTSTAAPTRAAKSRAYGIVRSSPRGGDVPSTSGRKSKTGRRETKRKLSKDLKWEIAQYALQHGTRQAVHHYSQQVGKRISEKKIDKFVRRYQQRQERVEARQN